MSYELSFGASLSKVGRLVTENNCCRQTNRKTDYKKICIDSLLLNCQLFLFDELVIIGTLWLLNDHISIANKYDYCKSYTKFFAMVDKVCT